MMNDEELVVSEVNAFDREAVVPITERPPRPYLPTSRYSRAPGIRFMCAVVKVRDWNFQPSPLLTYLSS